MLRERLRHVFNVLQQGLASPPASDNRINDPFLPARSHSTPPLPPRDYGSCNKDSEIGLGDRNLVVSPGTSIHDRRRPVVIPPSTPNPNGRKLLSNTPGQCAGLRSVDGFIRKLDVDRTTPPGSSIRPPCSLELSLRCSYSDEDLGSSNGPPAPDTNVALAGVAGTFPPTTTPVTTLGARQVSDIPVAVGYPIEAPTRTNDGIIEGHLKGLLIGSRSPHVRSSNSRAAEATYPTKREYWPEEVRTWVSHEADEVRNTSVGLLGSLVFRSQAQGSSPSLNPSHSPSSLATRVSGPAGKGAGGEVDGSNQTRSGLSNNSASQPPLTSTLDGAMGLDTPTARNPSSEPTPAYQPSSALVPACHVDPAGSRRDDQSSRTLTPSGSQSFVIDASLSGTTSHRPFTTSGHDAAVIDPSEPAGQPAESRAGSDVVEACDEEVDGHATPRSAFASADDICPTQRRNLGNAAVSPPEEPPVTTNTATHIRTISDSESGSLKVHDRSYNKCNEMLSSINPNAIIKGSGALCLSCLMGIGGDERTCTRPSSILSRRQRSTPLSKFLTVLSSGLEDSWTVGLPMKRNQHAATIKTLSLASVSVRPRQRKPRVGHLLRSICPYTFAFDPNASGSSFHFGQAFGVDQTPGNTFPRSGDGGGIWSGQGPGADLNTLLLQAPGSSGISNRFEDLVQAFSSSFPGPSHASTSSSITQFVRNAPDPPVPLRSDTLRELLFKAFSAGIEVGIALGNTRTSSSEIAPNGSGPQQPNPPAVVQEGVTSSTHHSAPGPSVGPSRNEANWPPDMPLIDLDAPNVSGLPGVQPPLDVPAQPTNAPTIIGNTQDPVGDIAWDSWIQPSALHVHTYPSVTSDDPGVPSVANRPPDGDTNLSIMVGQSTGPSKSISVESQAHPAQVVTAPTIGLELQTPATQPEDGGNEDRHRCKHCSVSFRRRYLLDDHISVVHKKGKRHPCIATGCKKRYASHSGMMRHFKQAHPQTVNSQDASLPSIEQAQAEIQVQTPGAGPSNRSTFRGNTRSSRAFIPYDPNSARHKSC